MYCSEVAACVGCHKYKQVHEALEQVWARADPASFEAAQARNGSQTVAHKVKLFLNDNPELVNSLQTAETLVASGEQDAQVAVQGVLGSHTLSGPDSQIVQQHIRSSLYTTFGTHAEHPIVDLLNSHYDLAIEQDNSLRKKVMGTVQVDSEPVEWRIAGRADGFREQRTIVVEIKNRVNRLCTSPPLYELMQTQSYCHLFDASAQWVEAMQDDEGGCTINSVEVPHDPKFWENEVLPKLQAFMQLLVDVVADTKRQDDFMSSKKRNSLVTKWLSTSVTLKLSNPNHVNTLG